MSFDGIMLSAIKSDLLNTLLNGRIDKIYQIDNYTITLLIRNNDHNHRLLISADPDYARLHITRENYTNPPKAPDFCMLLRKYLLRGIITDIEQPDFERILNLEISLHGKSYNLLVEIMGKYSNIILVDEKGIILDAIRRVNRHLSREREIYPGIKYVYPPRQDKINPLTATEDIFYEKTANFSDPAFKAIMNVFRGIGPHSAREIVFRAGIKPETVRDGIAEEMKKALWREFNRIFLKVRNEEFQPAVGINTGKISYISPFPLTHRIEESLVFEDTGSLFDFYYQKEIRERILGSIKNNLGSVVKRYLQKNLEKQSSLQKELLVGENAGEFRNKGELIKANLYQLKKGMKEASVIDYYDPEQKEIRIPLDPALSPSANAQKYFKKYTKARKSVKYIKDRLAMLKDEEKYLNQVLLSIEQAESRDELREIEEELISESYLKKRTEKKNKKTAEAKVSEPYRFLSSDNYEILVGRNNRQNDYLSRKIANGKDIWLHVKDLAGSHVIIRRHSAGEIPSQTLKEAAVLAAYYSRGRMSENVAVDFTEARNVHKAKGAKPGLVYYENYQTIFVKPDKDLVEKLKK